MHGMLPSAAETVCGWQEYSVPLLDWQFSNLPRFRCRHSLCLRPQTGDLPKLGMDQSRTKDCSHCSSSSESSRATGTLQPLLKSYQRSQLQPSYTCQSSSHLWSNRNDSPRYLFFTCLMHVQEKWLCRRLNDMIFPKLRPRQIYPSLCCRAVCRSHHSWFWRPPCEPRWLQKSFPQPWRLRCFSKLACRALQIPLPHLINVKLVQKEVLPVLMTGSQDR